MESDSEEQYATCPWLSRWIFHGISSSDGSYEQQIGLLVAPLMVLVGWVLSIPMTLEYTIFESCALMFSLIMINLLLSGGKSDYFKGVLLVAVYLVSSHCPGILIIDCRCFGMVRTSGLIGCLIPDC
jgi:hypothetical protein